MNPEPVPSPLTFALDAGRHVGGTLYAATASRAHVTFILAHGAGAPLSHPFIVSFARGLASRGVDVVTFNFPYMDARRKMPDSAAVLEACYAAVVGHVCAMPELDGNLLVIGGKSMGGRIASQLVARDQEAAEAVEALVFLGYPLHPPGKPSQLRIRHLPDVRRPMLFVQGSRDAFGTPTEIERVIRTLTPLPDLLVVEGGDHSFSIPKTSEKTATQVFEHVQGDVARWIVKRITRRPRTER